jgi:hypothetical protein
MDPDRAERTRRCVRVSARSGEGADSGHRCWRQRLTHLARIHAALETSGRLFGLIGAAWVTLAPRVPGWGLPQPKGL